MGGFCAAARYVATGSKRRCMHMHPVAAGNALYPPLPSLPPPPPPGSARCWPVAGARRKGRAQAPNLSTKAGAPRRISARENHVLRPG
jgi:hypothetical protein